MNIAVLGAGAWGTALAIALAAVAYQIPGVPALIADRTSSALSTGGAGRTDIWSVAGTIYQSSPVLGVGYANFPVAYTPQVVRASVVRSLRMPTVVDWNWLPVHVEVKTKRR